MVSKESLGSKSQIMVPQVHHKLLPRNDIIKIIDNASRSEVICIVAPYGCGKTLAVISWLRERERQAAWLNLDKDAGSESAFLAYLTAAVLSIAQDPSDKQELSKNDESINDPRAFLREAALRSARDNRENILVIDNFHFIRDAGLLRFIKDFIYTLLGDWRVIIISRAELPPVFNDLMLKRHICLINLKELGFSTEEMAAYFMMNGCDVPRQDIMQMRSATEGWPAALNVILTVSRGGPVGYGESAREYVMGFFETEIWSGLSEDIKDFMLKTSILETLTPANCHAVTETGATLPTLQWMFLNGLFITKMDERDTYQYRRVFRDFLRDKLRSSGIDESKLYMKVAWWLFERDEIAPSFPYFFKAGDLYGISRVLKILNPANMGIESFLELTSCITTLSIKDLKPYPVIIARMALIHYLKGNVAEMQSLYNTFLEWSDPGVLPVSPEEYAEYVWEAGWLCYLNPAEEVLNNAKHEEWTNYREYVPHLKVLHTARGAVLRFPSVLRGIRDYCSVVNYVEPFMKRAEETGQSTVREEVSIWEIYLIIAEYAYETENFKKAEEIVRRIMALTEGQQFTDLYFVCTALLVRLMRAIHNTKEIDALTNRLETMIMHNQDCLLPNFHAFEQRNRLASGQAGFTEVFEKENRKYMDKPYFYLLYRHVTFVRVLLSTGNYNEAMLILGNLDMMCHNYKRTMDLMEINVLKSIASYGLGNEDSACNHLTQALQDAEKYGYIRIFSDEAKDLWPILELVSKRLAGTYIKNIIISCKKTLKLNGNKLPVKKYTHTELTKTELNILKSLQVGMSYKEISLDNNIQLSTVKSHVHSIYSKLDVDNKTSAVMTAQNLGILE